MRRSLIARALAARGRRVPRPHRLRRRRRPADQSGSGPARAAARPSPTIVVGSANFTENQILAEIYAQALQAKGVNVTKKLLHRQPRGLLPGPAGRLDRPHPRVHAACCCSTSTSRPPRPSPTPSTPRCRRRCPAPSRCWRSRAPRTRTRSSSPRTRPRSTTPRRSPTCAANCGQLTFGGPPEFKTRPDGIPGLQKTYNCTFKDYKSLDAGGPLTVAALKNGDVQAADIFTTDASIVANNFVVLDDPKNNFAAQNVVPLINKSKVNDTVTNDAQRDLGEAHHRGAHEAQRRGVVGHEAEPGDRGEELAEQEQPHLGPPALSGPGMHEIALSGVRSRENPAQGNLAVEISLRWGSGERPGRAPGVP